MNYSRSVPAVFYSLSACLALGISARGSDWPQWRGPDRSDVSKESGLLKEWPEGGPKQVWVYKNGGNGYSGPAIVAGKLFTLGTRDQSEVLMALDVKTATELWTAKVGPVYTEGHGDGPRCTPTVDGDRVYALGGRGTLICAQVADGKILWQQTMQELGGRAPGWGYTESVLVDGNQVVCTPGGSKGAIAALDKMTGKVLWQSREFTDGAQYSSIIIAQPHGSKQYVQLTQQSIVGISPSDGKLLWKSSFTGRTAVVPTPIFSDNSVYVAAGYGVGCKLVHISADNKVSDGYENRVMKNHHGGVVLVDGHLYGYSDGVGWVCQNFKTGEEVWSERKALGKGAVSSADGMLYCVDEGSGTVVLAEASPKGWKEHGRFKIEPQSSIRSSQGRVWTHPVIVDGKLFLRDQDMIYCYNIAQK